jgi:hypothetical protein
MADPTIPLWPATHTFLPAKENTTSVGISTPLICKNLEIFADRRRAQVIDRHLMLLTKSRLSPFGSADQWRQFRCFGIWIELDKEIAYGNIKRSIR